jgi:hypothetical protein
MASQFKKIIGKLDKLGFARQEIATALSISTGHFSRIMSGERPTTQRHVDDLKKHLQQLVNELAFLLKDGHAH